MLVVLSAAIAMSVFLIYLSATGRWARPRQAAEGSPFDGLREFLREAGAGGVGVRDFLAASIAAGAATGGAAQIFLGWPVVTAASGLAGLGLPAWYLHGRRERRKAILQEALAEAVDALRSSVRAGLSLEDAIAGLGRNGPLPLRDDFNEVTRDLRLVGLEEAVRRLKGRLADPVFDTVAAALLMAHRIGGRNLVPVLDGLSASVRGTVRVRREARADQAKHVLSARVIAALPLVLIVAIRATNPDYLEAFSAPGGQLALAACLLSVAVGYAGMLRAAALPEERRVLR